MSDGLSLTITGRGLFSRPPSDAERAAMDLATAAVAGVPDRCATCALRPETPANNSKLVFMLIRRCLDGALVDNFMCHHGVPEDEAPTRACAGYLRLKEGVTMPTFPSPGEPVQLLSGKTALISSKLGVGPSDGEWRVIVKDPDKGNRRMVVRSKAGDFMWSEKETL